MIINLTQHSRLSVICATFFLWSCGGSSTQENSGNEFEDQGDDAANAEVVEQIDKVLHELPPPSEIPLLLEQIGAEFNSDFTNSISNVDSYESNDKAALNLGIYATDAGYYASYGQVQESLKYVEGCQDLAGKIGISTVFSLDLMRRFEENVGNRDSLAALVNQAMAEAEVQLEKNDRTTFAALVLVGSYIEGMHIATQVIKNYPEDIPNEERNLILEPLIKLVADLEPALLDLIGVLNSIERDQIMEDILVELGVLRFYYQEIGGLEERIQEDPAHVVINDGYLKDVIEEVERIRDEITG